jgi:phage N-6-adenine-methyltransferase
MAPKQKPGKSKQDYQTPIEFLDAARAFLGIKDFDIDLAASAANAVTSRFYDETMNSLVQPWKVGDGWNWLNPPFAHIKPWVERAFTMSLLGAKTAVLVPAGVGANWWRDWVHNKAYVLFLNGRITFGGTTPNPKTGKPDAYPKDCALLLYDTRLDNQLTNHYGIWQWTQQTISRAAAPEMSVTSASLPLPQEPAPSLSAPPPIWDGSVLAVSGAMHLG